ncbi:hypothetical protein [Cognatiyoonia sp. IB215182]|uniref:hypothetical protein n=1 Tax=Cognatiyoonia sp. IB215182 TaxID=3097353 RepID=UPI002A185881|nr:hypothetical protein [Cognatiyoonia sp. IB215182]MDX8354282.1 hypothetical protein [Cognatiyoonia sp. IB215182]
MGAWGAGLYQCDEAADVKETFADTVKLPVDVDELVARVTGKSGLGTDPLAEEEVDGWLVIADQLHLFGLDHQPTFETALNIIDSGADLKAKEDLDMSPRDLKKRAQVLQDLKAKWAAPHPKPRKRRMMKGPEKYLFEIGDVWIMPAAGGAPLPFDWHGYDPATIDQHYKPEGWAGFAVFDRWRHEDFYARYLIAILHIDGADKPTLEAAADLPIRHVTDQIPYLDAHDELKHRDVVSEQVYTTYVRTPGKTLRMWQAERLGSLGDMDAEGLLAALKGEFKDVHTPPAGVASIEHLMTLTSFHHNFGWSADNDDTTKISETTSMPLSRFVK